MIHMNSGAAWYLTFHYALYLMLKKKVEKIVFTPDSMDFALSSYCRTRTELYHSIHHYKYKLFVDIKVY